MIFRGKVNYIITHDFLECNAIEHKAFQVQNMQT